MSHRFDRTDPELLKKAQADSRSHDAVQQPQEDGKRKGEKN